MRRTGIAGGIRGLARYGAALIELTALLISSHGSAQTKLTVSAAASLKEALAESEAAYRQSHGDLDFTNNFGSSGTLAAQIDQGAPVDVFLSAASKPMGELETKGLIDPGTRHSLLRNTLVLIAPLDSSLKDFDGLSTNSIRVIALGDPASVLAGKYGQQTLT